MTGVQDEARRSRGAYWQSKGLTATLADGCLTGARVSRFTDQFGVSGAQVSLDRRYRYWTFRKPDFQTLVLVILSVRLHASNQVTLMCLVDRSRALAPKFGRTARFRGPNPRVLSRVCLV